MKRQLINRPNISEDLTAVLLAGVELSVLMQMERTGILRSIGLFNVFLASEGRGEALLQAVDAAEQWLATVQDGGVDPEPAEADIRPATENVK